MNNELYQYLIKFKQKYPFTISWRIKKHAKVISEHLYSDEKILYAFCAQKNDNPIDIITTYALVLTDKRIIIGQKRLLFGYFIYSITPDMYNDMTIKMGLLWGKIYIDTIKELVKFSNIQKSALPEIQKNITNYMLDKKVD